MYNRLSHLKVVLATLIVVIVGFPTVPSRAQDQSLAAYSMGVLQSDGTVLYSILFASGEQPLTDVTISAAIPSEAVSSVPVIAPADAILVIVPAQDTIQWQVKTLEAATVVGPFTYRVTFPADFKKLPASTSASVSWAGPNDGSIQAEQLVGTLIPLTESGDVQVTPSGMVDTQGNAQPIPIGDTGIVLYVPENAVSTPITLHFTRLPITEQTMPQSLSDTWWCALVKIESNSPLSLKKPIVIGLPTRQVLTPGMTVQILVRNAETDDWKPLDTAQGVAISALGNLALVMVTGQIPSFVAAGVAVKDRQLSAVPVSLVVNQTGFAGIVKVFSTASEGFAGRTH